MEPLILMLRREGQLDRTDTIPCLASSCRHERTIMKIIPPRIDTTLKSIKRTLHEKPALMPLTPEAPATLEGSLHPGHAIREEAKFIQKKASNATNRSINTASIIFRSYASGFLVHRLLNQRTYRIVNRNTQTISTKCQYKPVQSRKPCCTGVTFPASARTSEITSRITPIRTWRP